MVEMPSLKVKSFLGQAGYLSNILKIFVCAGRYLDLPQLVHNLSLNKMFFKQLQAVDSCGTLNLVCFMVEMHKVYFTKMTEM